MKTDPTSSISSTAGLSSGWSAHVASGTTNTRADKSKLNQTSITDSLETTDREADGRSEWKAPPGDQTQLPPNRPSDQWLNESGRMAGDKPLGKLLDWSG